MAISRYSVVRLLAAPRPDTTGSGPLGFDRPHLAARQALDRIPRTVVVGFEAALESRDHDELVHRIELLDPQLHGFGYEGATMAWTILDATVGGDRVRRLLEGPARDHLFLAYIGIGFAMGRLPRRLWHRVMPDIDAPPYHPTLSWLAVDGYGFDLAYFDRATYVAGPRQPRPWPWLGRADYFPRAVDQGIGRALWFIEGADVERTHDAVAAFDASRHADLWAGIGLAAAFAGPDADVDYAALVRSAGSHTSDLGVGAIFAARARVSAGHVPEHTVAAVEALTRLGVEDAADLADATAIVDDQDSVCAYEAWRRQIAARLDV